MKVSPAFAASNTLSNSSLSASTTTTANQDPNTDTRTGSSDITTIGIPIAFVAGILSFLSPCILPIIPSFVAFITGMSSDELLNKNNKRKSISEKDEESSSTVGSNVDIKADVSGIEAAAEEEFEKTGIYTKNIYNKINNLYQRVLIHIRIFTSLCCFRSLYYCNWICISRI